MLGAGESLDAPAQHQGHTMDYEKTFKARPDWLTPHYSDGYYLLPVLAGLAWVVLTS